MDKLFLRNFDIFSNNDLNIERLCEDDGDGTVECPFKADCRFKEIKSGENRQEIIECISNCDETDIVQFPLTKTPGTTSDKAQIGKNNMFYIAAKPVILPERACPEGFQKNKSGDCCSAKPNKDCDINCLTKKCSNHGWVNNQFSTEEYQWNDFQCCPNGSCSWNSLYDKDKGICVGKIDESPPVGLSDEVIALKPSVMKIFILRTMAISNWVTMINSCNENTSIPGVIHWSYDNQWYYNYSNSNQIYQQFRYFVNFIIKNYGDGPWNIPVYLGNYSSYGVFYGNLSFQRNSKALKKEILEKQSKENVCNKILLPNDECMIMYGSWISNAGLVDKISVNNNNEKVYIKFDHIYTKMVSVKGESKYYQGPLKDYKPCNWPSYTSIQNGLYIIRTGQPHECDCNWDDSNSCISISFHNNSYNYTLGKSWFDNPISNDTIQLKDYIQTNIFEKIADNISEKVKFPVLTTIPKWKMEIEFRLENYNVQWLSIIGNMYNNNVPGRGWGIWINRSLKTLHFSGKANVIDLVLEEQIELNIDYKIVLVSLNDRLVIQLENQKTNKKTYNNLIKSDFAMNDDIAMATIGGKWDNYSNGEVFSGKIKKVSVFKLDELSKYKKYSKELSKSQCNNMGLSNWSNNEDTFTCDNFMKSKLELECDFTNNSRSVFKDYKILDNKNVAIGLKNPSVVIEGLDQLGFKNKLYEMYYRNGGDNPQKNEASNVYEYWNKCKNVRGYGFLKDMNLLDPNSTDFKCYYKNSNQCIFTDFKKDGDSCVSSTKDLVYSSSNLSSLNQNDMIQWLEDLNKKNDGDDMKTSWSAVSYDYWQRCKAVDGIGVPVKSFDPNKLNKELKAIFYEHCDYQGRSIELGQGSYDYNFINNIGFNDVISSIKVPKGLRVVVFEHDLNNGRSLTLVDNNSCLINNSFNDVISSIIVINIAEQTRYLGELEFKKPRKKRGVETCDTSIIPGTNKSCSGWSYIDTRSQYNNGLPRNIPPVYPPDTCWTGTSCTDPKNLSIELDLFPYWSFNLRDKRNNSLSVKLSGKAKYEYGYLNLSDGDGYLETEPIKTDIADKTLEAWVSLNNIDQTGSGIITIQTLSGEIYDGINFGENNPQKWSISSENFNRTVIGDGEKETSPELLTHIVAVYNKDNSIDLYKNGKLYYTKYTKGKLIKYKSGDAIILLGNRNKQGKNNILNGTIYQAALYDFAITSKEVMRLFKDGITGCPTLEEPENAPLCPIGTQVCLNLSSDKLRVQDKYCYDPSKNSMVSTFFVREYDKCSLTNEGKVSGQTERTLNGTKVWFRQSGRDQCAGQYIDSGMIGKIKGSNQFTLFGSSVILSKEQSTILKNWFIGFKNAKLLYRATRDGFNAKSFHKLCDGKGSTITIVKTDSGAVFGGFTNIDWRQSDNYYKDQNAFLFTLVNPHNISPSKIMIKNADRAVLVSKESGPCFGNDIIINFKKNTLSQESYTYDINNMLTKSNEFNIEEIEVWNAVDNNVLSDSIIIKTENVVYFKQWITNIDATRLLYRGSLHGWSNRSFHNNVDGNSNTIIIIKTNDGNIFGGFNSVDWGSINGNYVSDSNSFLFTIKNPHNISPVKILLNQSYISYALYQNQSYGPTFGGGHDLYTNLDNKSGYINPWGYTIGLPRNDLYYGKPGGTTFNIDEIEVYGLINNTPFMGTNIMNTDNINKLTSVISRFDYASMLYSGIRDGIDINKFYEKCSNKNPLIVILTLNDGNKVGCYITINITKDQQWSGIDYDSFIFDFRDNDIYKVDENNQINTFIYGNNSNEYIFFLGDADKNYIQFGIAINNGVMTFLNNSKGGVYKNSNNNQFILNGANQNIKQIEVWNVFLTHPFFKSDQITNLTLKYEFPQLLNWLPDLTGLSLLYNSKINGFNIKIFHDLCDNKGPTLLIIKTLSGKIIGGCAFKDWGQINQWVTDKDAFLFNIVNKNQYLSKFGNNPENNHLYMTPNYGPTFGAGHDLYIGDNKLSGASVTYTDSKKKIGVYGNRFALGINESIVEYEVWSMQFYIKATESDLNKIINFNNMNSICDNNFNLQTAFNKCNELAQDCNFIKIDKKLLDQKSIGNACFSVNPPVKPNIYTVNQVLTFEFTGNPQLFNVGNASKIKIEVFGAAGGPMGGSRSIEGGISSGTYTIQNQSILYVYVGGMGIDGNKGKNRENVPGGWNGGGDGGFDSSSGGSHGASGGGATDVRLKLDDLNSRIIVAGGGGGSNNSGNWGGKGGGSTGEDGYTREVSWGSGYGTGGSQNAGGQSIGAYNIIGTSGILGKGGNGSSNVSCYGSGGGGGGYYGGGGGAGRYLHGSGYGGAGGGGSGYIGGVQNGATNTIGGKYGDGRCIITVLELSKSNQIDNSSKIVDNGIPDFNSKFGNKTSGTSFELGGWKLVSSIGTYGNEGLPAILSKIPPPLMNTDNDYPRMAGFTGQTAIIGIIGPIAKTLIGFDWYGCANYGSNRNAKRVNLYASDNDHSNNMTQNFIHNNSLFLGNFIVPQENITTLIPYKVNLNPVGPFKSYYFVILDNYGDSSVKVGSIYLNFQSNIQENDSNIILKKKYIQPNLALNVSIPASEIKYQNRRLVYYNNSNFPYLNPNLEGLNRYIAKSWGFAQYSNRTEAPMSSVLSQYGPNPPFLYHNNWESSWWCLNNVDNNNELLLIEFDVVRNITNITAKNWDTYGNNDAGDLEVLTVLKMSNNEIIDVKTLGSINLRNSNQVMGTLSLNQPYKNLLFQRKNITGWSKLENIIIN